MSTARGWWLAILAWTLLRPAGAEEVLTLAQARSLAQEHHPRISEARYRERSAQAAVTEADAAYYPSVVGVGTAAWADAGDTRLAAGAINNPTVFSRTAAGLQGSWMITDFGRTSNIVASARFDAEAGGDAVAQTRQEIQFEVDRTFFTLLQAQAIQRVAQEAVASRQQVVDQTSALARNQLRSQLDIGFAQEALGEARLLEFQSRDEVADGYLELSSLLSQGHLEQRPLDSPAISTDTAVEATMLIDLAMHHSPVISRLKAQREALNHLAQANGDQARPVLSVVGALGYVPTHDDHLSDTYAAAAVNLSVPLFNGFAYSARRDEASNQAKALDRQLADVSATLETDIRIAVMRLGYLREQVAMMRQISDQALLSSHLAASRFRLGSTSIIELNTAQLNQLQSDIGLIRATYDYRIQESLIDRYVGGTDVVVASARGSKPSHGVK
jgi:outer membrane protein